MMMLQVPVSRTASFDVSYHLLQLWPKAFCEWGLRHQSGGSEVTSCWWLVPSILGGAAYMGDGDRRDAVRPCVTSGCLGWGLGHAAGLPQAAHPSTTD